MPDIYITCTDCGKGFPFTEKDQAYYKKMADTGQWTGGFSPPKRCRICRNARKARQEQFQNTREPEPHWPENEWTKRR